MPEPLRSECVRSHRAKVRCDGGARGQPAARVLERVSLCGGDRGRIIDDFQELGNRAAGARLRVGYEALSWGRHVFDHRDAWSIVRDTNHPAIGLILDSFHSLARKVPIESLPDIDPAKIFLLQLADAPLLEMDLLLLEPAFPQPAGAGRPRDRAVRGGAARTRIRRHLVAGDLQRPIPGEPRIDDGGRWHAFAALSRGSGVEETRTRQAGAAAAACAMPRHRVRRVCGERRRSRAAQSHVHCPGFLASRPASVQRRDPLESARHQLRDQQRAGKFCAGLRQRAWRLGLRAGHQRR